MELRKVNENNSNTTLEQNLSYIEDIKENSNYIKIGIEKYKVNLNNQLNTINNILGLDILIASLDEIRKKIEDLEFTKFITVTEEISILAENLWAIVLEEKDPILPKLNKIFEEEENER